jgi:predicted nucleotidyltransferase
MFATVEERDRVRDRVLELASADDRVVAAAIVGSLAHGAGDEWSDLDLTFGVADEVPVADVLDHFTRVMVEDFDAVTLVDLDRGGTTYRVFLLPDWLQVDLSFTPASAFREASPRFKLVFGTHRVDHAPPPSTDDLLGWAVVFARHARVCIERRRWWQAEHMVSAVRDNALTLACLHRGLPTGFGRGFDDLPADVLADFDGGLVRSLGAEELRRALAVVVSGLLRHAGDAAELAAQVEPQLRALTSPSP